MSKFKSFFGRVKRKILVAALSAAIAVSTLSIAACAEETTSSGSDLSAIIQSAGDTLKEEFVLLVQTMVPLLISIGVVGLSIFAIVSLFGMAKKFFKKAAG